MRLQHTLAVALLGLGFVAAPAALAADAPAKEAPREGAERGGDRGGRGGGQRGPGGFVDRFHEQVNAVSPTEEQKKTIEPAFTEAKAKIEAAVKEAGEDRAKIREKTQPIMEELRTKVNAVLTAEQKEKLEKARQERGGPGGGGRGGRGGEGGNRGERPAN